MHETLGLQRRTELDGLRGIAAVAVFAGHAIGMLPDTVVTDAIRAKPLLAFYGGHSPVYLFFVLSGFVLSLPFLQGGRDLRYPAFAIQRAFRIYPAFWAALIFSLLAMFAHDPARMTGLSEWAQSFWIGGIESIPVTQIARSFALIISFDHRLIDPPTWSLLVELRMSLLVPLLILALRQSRSPLFAACILAATYVASLSSTLVFLPMFCLGAILAKFWGEVTDWAAGLSAAKAWGLLALALLLYAAPFYPGLEQHSTVAQNITSVAAAIAIVLSSSRKRLTKLLTGPLTDFFGRISYSFYLLHLPVLLVVFSVLYNKIGAVITIAVALVITALISSLCHRWIEVPFNDFGKAAIKRTLGRRRKQGKLSY